MVDLRKVDGDPRKRIFEYQKSFSYYSSKIRAGNMRRSAWLISVFPKEYYPMLANYEEGLQYEVINWISEVTKVNRRTAFDIWLCLKTLYREFQSLDDVNKENIKA